MAGRARAFLDVQQGCDHSRARSASSRRDAASSRSVPIAGGGRVQVRALVDGRDQRDRADRGGSGELSKWRGRAGRSGAHDPARCAGAEAAAALVARSGGDRPGAVAGVRRRRAVDAASAPVAAGGVRPDPQAHAAAPFTGGRARGDRPGASTVATRHRDRGRPDRRLPDRDRRASTRDDGDDRARPRSPTCMCFPFSDRPGHAGGPHAFGARCRCAGRGPRRCASRDRAAAAAFHAGQVGRPQSASSSSAAASDTVNISPRCSSMRCPPGRGAGRTDGVGGVGGRRRGGLMALGFFSRLKEGLSRSTQKLTGGISGGADQEAGWTTRRWMRSRRR